MAKNVKKKQNLTEKCQLMVKMVVFKLTTTMKKKPGDLVELDVNCDAIGSENTQPYRMLVCWTFFFTLSFSPSAVYVF